MGVGRFLKSAASVMTFPLKVDDFLGLIDPLSSGKQLRGVVDVVRREAKDSVTVTFKPGREWENHVAGQWVRVGIEIDGVRHWRSYSLSSAAGAAPSITVTDIGLVSGWIGRHTRPGDIWYLEIPQGDFVLPESPRPLLMITAGSGITPVMSMLRTLIKRRQDADVVVLHSARTPEVALFTDELREMAEKHPGLRIEHRWTAEQGRIDLSNADDLDEAVPDWRTRAAYVCGPEAMLDAAIALWASEEEALLTVEKFTPPQLGAGGEGGRVTFTVSDGEVEADGSTPLLFVGEDAGILMPSGCRMGICRSCLTPLVSGRVRDLTTGEVVGDEGELIRTCVSAAAGDVRLEC